jgi:hypothetical protein
MAEPEEHWWDAAAEDFEGWLATESDEVRALSLLEQIDLYAEFAP